MFLFSFSEQDPTATHDALRVYPFLLRTRAFSWRL